MPINGVADQSVPVCVSFKIFDNAKLRGRPLDSGEAFTTYDVDFTVKFEATHLKPDTSYWYQFADCTNAKTVSRIGATRTISSPNSTWSDFIYGTSSEKLWCSSCEQSERRKTSDACSLQLLAIPILGLVSLVWVSKMSFLYLQR